MKKISLLFLVFCLCLVSGVPMASAASDSEKAGPVPNERVINVLKDNNIDFEIVDGSIKLNEPTSEVVSEANNLLNSESQLSAVAATSYPTSWVHMRAHDVTKSKKFTAATKTAFVATFTAWARNITISWKELVAVAAGGFSGYYFVTSDTEDLYTFIKYYYREVGPGKFDMNGYFIGDYEIKKGMRVTKNSNDSGGSYDTDIRESTIIDAFF
ncbi:hypothetical protein EEL30_00205 (plasmid) [Brevibacillus laterosporus]|uniref:Uncharacterized protein n=1 Tax=Brevibacillus laterosporus TaxID=1465 RepID=A0A518V1S7_BRELA|nr:hypothetical protein EEL30_00205 [Brevibacillus laterosporus]